MPVKASCRIRAARPQPGPELARPLVCWLGVPLPAVLLLPVIVVISRRLRRPAASLQVERSGDERYRGRDGGAGYPRIARRDGFAQLAQHEAQVAARQAADRG